MTTNKSVINNVLSFNINNSDCQPKYFRKAVKITETKLEKESNKSFRVTYLPGDKQDNDLYLSTIKQFRLTKKPKLDGQLVLYEKSKNIASFYDTKYGTGWFEQKLHEINNQIIDDIFSKISNAIETYSYNKISFNKQITLDKDDRYTFYYGISNNESIYITIRKINSDKKVILQDMSSVFYSFRSRIDWNALELSFDKIKIKLYNHVVKTTLQFFKSKLRIGIPLSYLIVKTQEIPNGTSQVIKNLHIKFGYTFKDSRKLGYSTLLRKLLQIYAYDKSIDYITTNATSWGSQISSKRAGMFQMPIIKTQKTSLNFVPKNEQQKMFKPKNQSSRSIINETLRKAVYTQTKYTPKKQQHYLNSKRSGAQINMINTNGIFGTHARKIKGRKNVINSLMNGLLK